MQVYEWLQREKTKRRNKKGAAAAESISSGGGGDSSSLERSVSQTSTVSLDKLEGILHQYAEKRPRHIRRRSKGLRRGSFSESENTELETTAPVVDAFLDNTKTLGYSGNDGQSKEKENWLTFKADILRIIHTLRLKGWRRVPMEDVGEVDVVRLSGALTNAVYVVSPPVSHASGAKSPPAFAPKKPPP